MVRPQHLEFGPPPTPGLLRSMALALLAHGLLLLGLTVGIQWNHEPVQETVDAELWSSIPVPAAAPAAPLEAPPEPVPVPVPDAPPPPPPPVPVVQPDLAAEAAIATARDRAKRLKEEKAAQELAAKEKAIQEKVARDKAAREKAALDKLAKEKADKAEKAEKDKKQQQLQDSKQQKYQKRKQELADAKEAKQLDDLRKANLRRMAGMAGGGGNGAANSTSNALKGSGPSAEWSGRVKARIKANIVFTDNLSGNPLAVVEIRTSPSSGAILSARITQSSGVKSWDDAVLRAVEKTEVLPKDGDQDIPTTIQLFFRLRD